MNTQLPGYLSWFGLEQILWLCSHVLDFIYHNIAPNVGMSIILYALFAQILFLPFSLKKGWDRLKESKVQKKLKELKEKYAALPEEEKIKEETLERYKEEEKEIKKGKSSTKIGCLLIFIRFLVVLAATPVVAHFDYFVGPSAESYNFLGFDLNSVGPGYSFQPSLIFPIITTIVLVLPGIFSTVKNMRERKIVQAKKTKEELEEEARMLKEMGIKENKIPWGIILQLFFGLLYFNMFSKVKLTISLFWGVYYAFGFCTRGLINFVFTKISERIYKE